MTVWIALLRAVNVGGKGTLLMRDLRTLCDAAGFGAVRTHGASGNAVFESGAPEEAVRAELARRLEHHAGRPVGVLLRSAEEMGEVIAAIPFAGTDPSRTVTIFLADPLPEDALEGVAGRGTEEVAFGRREIFVHYPDGMGRSRLRIPAARDGTARNMATLASLLQLAAEAAG